MKTIRLKEFVDMHKLLRKEYNLPTGKVYGEKIMDGVSTSLIEGLNTPIYSKYLLIDGSLKLSFLAIPFLFKIDGHDKNFLLFVMAYCIKENCIFEWNRLVAKHYADLYLAVTGEEPSYGVVRQSLYSLRDHNVIKLKERGVYMLNPILYAGSSQYNRKEQMKAYVKIKTNKSKTTSA